MKTVRFTNLVRKCGKPENHLILVKPQQDKTLQHAVKEKRVLTVYQSAVGVKAEYGDVGFAPGASRQFFIFSKSLKAFEGKRVTGIKYEDLETADAPDVHTKSHRAGKTAVKSSVKKHVPTDTKVNDVPKHKLVKFPEHEKPTVKSDEDDDNDEIIEDLKAQVRRAMNALEQGKQVAAFNLLKAIVDD